MQTLEGIINKISSGILLTLLTFNNGCANIRGGYYASPTIGTTYMGIKELGKHRTNSEGHGIVYTCNGGHIDIDHVRIAADWTNYLAKEIFKQLTKDKKGLEFKYDGCLFNLEFNYPEDWKYSKKENVAKEISNNLASYLAFDIVTWHEIITWFGYKSTILFPEFHSAFSWEDSFSNLLGCYAAKLALQDEKPFDEAMTSALENELIKLNVQESEVAKKAGKKVKDKWYSDNFLYFAFVSMDKRNFDIGLDDGFVTPWIVSGLTECENAEAMSYPVPKIDFLKDYGLSMRFRIIPKILEKDRILKIIYPNNDKKWIEPVVHFKPIMEYIKKEAVKMYGCDVDKP